MKLIKSFKDFQSITEMAITSFQKIGDWNKNSSFRNQDRKLLTNPNAVSKIIQKWEKTEQEFNMYFVNSSEANKYTEVGQVSQEWLKDNLPKAYPEININSNAINIIFTNNKGDERVPMTAWIIAHRFSHAISRRRRFGEGYQIETYQDFRDCIFDFASTFLSYYGITFPKKEPRFNSTNSYLSLILVGFFEEVGTMKSARNKQLRNDYEISHELIAQYLLTGKITFNDLPKIFSANRKKYNFKENEKTYEVSNTILKNYENDFEYYIRNILDECVGKIFVM